MADKQLKIKSLAKKLSEELNKMGLEYIWVDPKENSVSRICKQIKERCSDTKRQNLFANIREKRSLIFYYNMKLEWARKEYTVCCTRNERSGLAWFKTGIWKLRWMRKGLEKGRCPLCSEGDDTVHILLKCSEARKWREELLSRKWLIVTRK
jgi:hypothetical protein